MVTLSPEDIAAIEQIDHGGQPALVATSIKDPRGGFYKLSPTVANAFEAANEDYKAIHGHDIPLASAYRDPDRNRAADGATHSNHLTGDALDIDRSAVADATPFLNAHGLHAIGGTFHGRSEDNHFELKGNQAHSVAFAPVPVASNQPAQNTPVVRPQAIPALPTLQYNSQGYAPLPASLSNPSIPTINPQVQQALHQIVGQSQQAIPLPGPSVPQDFRGVVQNSKRLYNALKPVGQPMPAQGSGGNLLQGIQQAIQTEAQNTKNPLDTMSGLGAGAVGGITDLLNGVSQLPADLGNAVAGKKLWEGFKFPTGDLDKYRAQHPLSDLAGQAIPFIALDLLTGGTAAPEEAASLMARYGKAAGIGAGIGAINDPRGAGLGGRFQNALGGAALGAGLHGLGEAYGAAAKRLFPGKITPEMSPEEIHAALTPEEEALIQKHIQATVPEGHDPLQASLDAQSLRNAFSDRAEPSKQLAADEFNQLFQKIQKPSSSMVDILGPDGKPISTVRQGLPTSLDKALDRFPDDAPQKGTDLLKGSALPEGRQQILQDMAPDNDLLAPTKSAKESADVFQNGPQAQDQQVAEGLLNEATKERADSEAELLKTTRLDDPVELGQRIIKAEDDPGQHAQMMEDRALLNRVLTARNEELQAKELLAKESEPMKLADLADQLQEESSSQPNPLRSSVDIAMDRANELGEPTKKDLLAMTKPAQRSPELTAFEKPEDRSMDLLKDIHRTPSDKPIEMANTPEPAGELLGPNGQPLNRAEYAPKPQALVEESHGGQINPEKPITQEMQADASKQGHTIIDIAEAQKFVKQHQPEQMEHFLNALHAGKNNQTMDVTHEPLEEGGRVSNEREVSPVGLTKKTILGKTEVGNLRHEYGEDSEGIRDNLVKRLADNGIKVNAGEQNLDGLKQAGVTRKLNALANRLPDHELTHVYVMDHNMGTTAREGSYGFRRLDRITDSSLTGKPQRLPEGTKYQNTIPEAYKALKAVEERADAPEALKKVSKQLDAGKITNKSYKELADAYKQFQALKPEEWAQFCKGLGL